MRPVSGALRPYVPRAAARWLRDQPSARHQPVDGTLVSADISGFTALSERLADHGRAGAETVVDVVNGCFEEMIAAATSYGGDVLKFGGDALLILFDGDGHARRAAVACAALRDVLTHPRQHPVAGEVPLSMSIGLHSGTIHLFLGRGAHAELIVAGRDASTAVRCESAASAGDILCSAATAALLDPDWIAGAGPDAEGVEGGMLLQPPVEVPQLQVEPEVIEGIDYHDLVPPSLARHVERGGTHSQIRPATTAFIAFSGLDDQIDFAGPRRVARTLQSLVEVVSQATESFNVHWLDTDIAPDGGKIHLAAGAPTATDDDDAAMLHAVRAILDTCADPPLAAGVNHGVVFTGDVGSPTRRTLAAMGDSVNLAARLSGKAGTGELVASLDVVEGSGTVFEAEPLEPFQVKGKSRPILAARVGQPETESAEEGAGDEHQLPLVARAEELALLSEAAEAAIRGHPQVVMVHGQRGIGKTRLAHELQAIFGDRLRVLATSCDPHQASTPFAPFRDLLQQVAGIDPGADSMAAGAALMAQVQAEAPELVPWTPLLAMPLGALVPPTPETDRVAPAFRRLRLQQTVTDYLRTCLVGPTLLLFEDVEWLDAASRDLLADLLLGVFDRSWCLVMASTASQEADTDADVIDVAVSELGEGPMTRLAELALGDTPMMPQDLAGMVEVAAGHPLFLLELVAQYRESGSLASMPRTVEAAVTTRFDQLAPADLAHLRELSVLGVEVRRDLATAVLGPESMDPEALGRMAAFVEVTDDRLRFRETLYQQVAYEGLAFGRRIDLHGQAAEALAEAPEDTLEWVVARALHLDRAGRHEAAWEACVAAGDAMRDVWATTDAADQYRRALANADQAANVPDWARAEVQERLGDVAEIASLYDTSIAAYEQALGLNARAMDRARLHRKGAAVDLALGEFDRGTRRLDEALDLLAGETRDGVATERASVAEQYGRIRYRQARFEEAIDQARRAMEEVGDQDPLVRARAQFILASAQMQQNHPDAAQGLRSALDVFIEHGDLISQGNCHTNLGLIAYYRGDWDRASAHYQSAQQLYGDAGYVLGAAIQALNFGEILSNQRRWPQAIAAFQDAKRRYRAMRAPLGVASANGHLGWIRAQTDDVGGGIELLQDAIEQFRQLEAMDFLGVCRAQLAEVLAGAGRPDEAAELIETALADDPPAFVRSALARCEGLVAVQAGDLLGAREAFERAMQVARDERLPFEEAVAARVALQHGAVDASARDELEALVTRVFHDLGVEVEGSAGDDADPRAGTRLAAAMRGLDDPRPDHLERA